MEALTIGQVAKQTGVGIETIRFYEREGLIAEPPRLESGYRQYAPEVLRRIRFIRQAKDLGFTLKEISELLALRVDPTSTCADVKGRAANKVTNIEAKIHSLERMRTALRHLIDSCSGTGPSSECPILDALDHEDDHANG